NEAASATGSQQTQTPQEMSGPQENAEYNSLVADAAEKISRNEIGAAFKAAKQAIEMQPDGYEAYFHAGFAAYRQGMFELSVRYFENAVEFAPENNRARVLEFLAAARNDLEVETYRKEAEAL